jgi:hypothetical protein
VQTERLLDPRFAARLRLHYRAALREHRTNPEISITLQTALAFQAEGLSDREIFDRIRPKHLFPLGPDELTRLRRDAESRATREQAEAQRIATAPAMEKIFRNNPDVANRLGVDLVNARGTLMRRWFGGRKMTYPVPGKDGQIEWQESHRYHTELPIETKRYLFELLRDEIGIRWFHIAKVTPGSRGRQARMAWRVLEELLVAPYRKRHRRSKADKIRTLDKPRNVWTLPPEEIVTYLAGSALKEARRRIRGERRRSGAWPALTTAAFDKIAYEAWEAQKEEPQPDGAEVDLAESLSGLPPEQRLYIELKLRNKRVSAEDLGVTSARLRVIGQCALRRLKRRFKKTA